MSDRTEIIAKVAAGQMDADAYLRDRLEVEIKWYDDKSGDNKRAHMRTKVIEIVCAALIPLLAGYAKNGAMSISIAIGVLGATVAVSAGVSSLMKFQENWIKYRTTAESLKKEKYLFLTGAEPYAVDKPLLLLVQRVETLVSQENTNWAQYMMAPPREKK